jgi:hypothetical protein
MIPARILPAVLALTLFSLEARAFETNDKKWPQMPVPYYVNAEACPAMAGGETLADLVEKAAEAWSTVPCATVSFQYLGTTTDLWAPDGKNVIFCVDGKNMEWKFGEGAGGATLWIPTEEGEPMEVDLALNAFDLKWVAGGGDAMAGDEVDPTALITHELGHWLGMSHTPDPYATMYYASLPYGLQATLAGDDKAGICTLYPSGEKECATEADCPEKHTCIEIQGIPVCNEVHDGPGTECNKDWINCEGICWVSFYECTQACLFLTQDYSEGYCAPLCVDKDCPPGFACTHVTQPGVDTYVCFLDDTPPEAGPEAAETGNPEQPQAAEVMEQADSQGSPETVEAAEVGSASESDETVGPLADQAATADMDAQAGTGGGGGGDGGCAAAPTAPYAPWPLVLLVVAGAALLTARRARKPWEKV